MTASPANGRPGRWSARRPSLAAVADSTITYLILVGAVVLFMSNRVPVALVAIGVSLSLWATGILDLDQALAGFGDPTRASVVDRPPAPRPEVEQRPS